MVSRLERLALERHLRISDRSRLVLRILDQARAPLSVKDIYLRARPGALQVSMATIQRTVNQLTAAGLLRRLDLPARRKQYEKLHHDQRESLIDSATGRRLEFHSEGIEGLLKYALQQLGYRLLDYRLELFGIREQQSAGMSPGAGQATSEPPGDSRDSGEARTGTPAGARSRRASRH